MIQRSLFLVCVFAAVSALAQNYTWTLQIPNGQIGSPKNREYHTFTHVKNATNATYSSAVLFGGISLDDDVSVHLNDTWILRFPREGWQQVNTTVHPPTRGYHTAVESDGQVIVFGGINAQSFIFGDTWRFNVTTRTWSEDAAHPPYISPRTFHCAAHADGIMYVFGGFASALSAVANDLWAYNVSAKNWTNLVEHDQPRSPPGREGATLTYVESELGPSLILFGGYNGKLGFNDLWQYYIRQNKWVLLNPDGNTDGPSRRLAHAAVGHSASSNKTAEIVVFGGFFDGSDSLPYYNDVWSLKLVGSVYSWKTLVPDGQSTGPAKRAGHAMIKAGNETFAFGGYVQGVGLVNDMWLLNYHL